MRRNCIFKFLTALLVFMTATSFCYAGGGLRKDFPPIASYKELLSLPVDTIPAPGKMPEAKTGNGPTVTTIKEVPKAKKQVAPVAVPVQVKVKPIKIIKPKIIRPVIKIN